MGGAGLFLLMLSAGSATFFIALHAGAARLDWPERAAAWALAALLVREIAFGFAMRPQIFTCLSLVALLLLVRGMHAGKVWRAAWLPVLFLAWINLHGGALAGICLLGAAAGATTLQFAWHRWRGVADDVATPRCLAALWSGLAASVGVLWVNPWGSELLRWLIASVRWLRPQITEWTAPHLGVGHLALFALFPLAVAALLFSRRRKALWEVAVLVLLGLAALRMRRHIPLFCIAALMLVPAHLADAVARLGGRVASLRSALANRRMQVALILLLLSSIPAMVAAACRHRQSCFTMEVPCDDYPVAATSFIRAAGLKGNLLVSFDWGEYALWELPDSPVSIDGRLDTCYPHAVIREYWRLYDGAAPDPAILDLARADYALVRARNDIGWWLLCEPPHRWTLVYRDPVAVVLVRDVPRHPRLGEIRLPVEMPASAVMGRVRFPDTIPAAVTR
jgi:hypothetical protein